MMYMRGNRADYDQWRQMGLTGWSYSDVLPLFPAVRGRPGAQGRPLSWDRRPAACAQGKSRQPPLRLLPQPARRRASAAMTISTPIQEGLGIYDFNIRDGRRESSATAYLRPVTSRANLAVWTGAGHADRAGRPQGQRLELVRGGETVTARARREIILSAGRSTRRKVLQLSGIGDPTCWRQPALRPAMPCPAWGGTSRIISGSISPVRPGTRSPLRAVPAGPGDLDDGVGRALRQGPATAVPLEAAASSRRRPELDLPDIHITFVPGLNLETTRRARAGTAI